MELNNVQFQSALELEKLLVNEFRKLVTSSCISLYIYTAGGVDLSRHKKPRGSAVGEIRKCERTAEVKRHA
jgi:hypothetical protein